MICAIDCDLRQSYCVTDSGASGRGETPRIAWTNMIANNPPMDSIDTTLFEVASPVSFNRGAGGHAAMTQLAKWAIWNIAMAMDTHQRLHWNYPGQQVLVSPSNVWTKGYDLHTRHAMAKCKQPKKDLRECEAMIWFYKQQPTDWKPLAEYLAAL